MDVREWANIDEIDKREEGSGQTHYKSARGVAGKTRSDVADFAGTARYAHATL